MYHIWAACSALASALQRRCYIKWGHSVIYPNMYVVLVGPSGKVRKGDPINISRSFVEALGIPMIGEENSPEYIMRKMKESLQNFTDRSTGRITLHSSMSCFVEELSVLTGEKNTRFLATLTNWYDSRDSWTRGTKNMGVDDIVGVCFNLLAATAPDWIPYIFTREAMGGGFTSRCIFVVEGQRSKIVVNPNKVMPNKALYDQLLQDLEVITTMSGEFKFSPDGEQAYEEWYEQQARLIDTGDGEVKDPALQGYVSRRATHVKKMAMITSVSRGDDYTITAKDFRRALGLLEITERRMPEVFAGTGSARYARETETILAYIKMRKIVTKSELLQRFYRQVDDWSLTSIIKVLSDMKAIRVVITQRDTQYEHLEFE